MQKYYIKKRIAQLADDLLLRYQNMRDERSQLHKWYFSTEIPYQKIKMYANLLYYLRMLALDYVNRYLFDAEMSSSKVDHVFSVPLTEQAEQLQAIPT